MLEEPEENALAYFETMSVTMKKVLKNWPQINWKLFFTFNILTEKKKKSFVLKI
jgi:hypothetical protein